MKSNLTTKAKGFTLIEILIALFIFSAVLIMTTGIVGQSSSYQTKIGAIRSANQELQKVADMITNDVRAANIGGKIQGVDYPRGVVILNCPVSGNCIPLTVSNGYATQASSSNTVVVFHKDGANVTASVYQSVVSGANKLISYKKYSPIAPATVPVLNLSIHLGSSNAIAGVVTADTKDIENDMTVNFAGYAPNSTSTLGQQAYVSFFINAQTRGYATLPVNSRTNQSIRSTVTVRGLK